MAKKKDTKKSLPFKPTGKMVVLIEMEGETGPFELRINDVDITLEVLSTLLKHTGNVLDVAAYTEEEEEILAKYVGGK